MSGLYIDSEEDELEEFNITNDDLINEFNPDRPTFRQTKEQALYGIWAKQPDKSTSRYKKKDISTPVTFISGGLKEGASKKKEEDNDADDNKGDQDVDGEEAEEPKPKKVLKTTLKKSSRPTGGKHAYSLTSKSVQKEKLSSTFGGFERHTKGIGMKLMRSMGYKIGKGLGKDNQGILNPIEAVKRTKKAGLGAAGTERTKQSFIHFPVQDSEDEEDKEYKEQISRWRKEGSEKSQKKYVYKTVDELRKTGKAAKKKKDTSPSGPTMSSSSALANVKVIDMTGREQKVFSGYHAIAGRHAVDPDSDYSDEDTYHSRQERRKDGFSCPELEHNLDMLIDATEQKILHNDRQLKYEQDRVVSLKHDLKRLQVSMTEEEKEIQRLQRVLQTVNQCEERVKSNVSCEFILDELAEVFVDLQEKYFTEYKMFEMSDLAVAFVLPQLKKLFSSWIPLSDPSHGTTEMKRWKVLLELDQSSFSLQNSAAASQQTSSDMYQYLVWESWMPRIRNAVYQWDPRNCEPMIELVEQWMPLLPQWILRNLLSQLILSRLQQEVDGWNPLIDPVPLHSWIHPWLPHLKDELEPLYGPIRQKLGHALQMWHPRDPSAKVILEPWHGVLSRGSWDAFMIKNIIPKLGNCLRDFIINPHDQSLAGFKCVIEWENLVPPSSLVTLLETHFFPKWLRALSSWLNSESVDYEEVTRWYGGWKSIIPEGLMTNSFVKDRFKQAIEMMNRAVTGRNPRANEQYEEDNFNQPPSRPYHPLSQAAHSSVPAHFRDLVQQKAEERGLVFVPLKTTVDGKIVYRFGSRAIYIDRSVVYMKEGDVYLPQSLAVALDKASMG